MRHGLQTTLTFGAILALPIALAGCELGPKESTQLGPRGAAMEQVDNLNLVKPAALPPASAYPLPSRDGQRARDVYPDLKVLGDISVDEFGLLMANITEWVVPKDAPPEQQGCNYCHNPENMASYEKYTKTVALKMLQMTQTMNVDWKDHVKQTGVTCYTCHRGKAVPEYNWSFAPEPVSGTILNNRHGQNAPSKTVGWSSLPNDPNGYFLYDGNEIRVGGTQIHPGTSKANIHDAEKTYGLMMRVSGALGVNCTFCHNAHNFGDWTTSRTQRVQAWHGIRMVREVNQSYIQPLKDVFPQNMGRLGPMGDPLKVNCQTCHQGYSKPMGGVSMLADNPALAERPLPRPAAAAPSTVADAGAKLMPVAAADAAAAPVATAPVGG
jgi:photosynthetic reaction center cytochrome c subunit